MPSHSARDQPVSVLKARFSEVIVSSLERVKIASLRKKGTEKENRRTAISAGTPTAAGWERSLHATVSSAPPLQVPFFAHIYKNISRLSAGPISHAPLGPPSLNPAVIELLRRFLRTSIASVYDRRRIVEGSVCEESMAATLQNAPGPGRAGCSPEAIRGAARPDSAPAGLRC